MVLTEGGCKMKRVLSILLFVVMAAVAFAGCNTGNVGETAASDSTAAVSSEAAKGPVTLTLVGRKLPNHSGFWVVKAIQSRTESNTVERISIPDENFEEKANLMICPDCRI